MSDISTLDENSKVVFFNNLFNIMTGIKLHNINLYLIFDK